MKLLFRTEGNSRIGLGHLVRSLALAEMLDSLFEILFFINKDAPQSYMDGLDHKGYKFFLIKNNEEFFNFINSGDGVILDGYHYESEIQQEIKLKGAALVCIDDLHDKHFFANIVINQALGITAKDYHAETYTKFLLGPDYAILRKEFLRSRKKIIRSGNVPFICFGGADIKNLTLFVVKLIDSNFDFECVNVITGSSYQHLAELKASVKTCRNKVLLYHDIDPEVLSGIMLSSDMAIVPSSSILLETLSLGLPVITGYYTDNQTDIYNGYLSEGLVIGADNFSNDQLLINCIRELRNSEKFKDLDKRSGEYFDGNSPARIRKEFVKLFAACCINLRPLDANDVKLLFDWVNDPQVRENSLNTSMIEWPDHIKWFHSKLLNKGCYMYIMEWNNVPVGQVRYDDAGNYIDIDYSIAATYRGIGLGEIIIIQSMLKIRPFLPPYKVVRAVVKESNEASAKAFIKNNFNRSEVQQGKVIYTFNMHTKK